MKSSPDLPIPRLGPPTRSVAVPTLHDPERGVLLRAHAEDDLARLVEEARDPLTRAWTNVPVPADGYDLGHARAFLAAVRAGWADGSAHAWAVTRGGPYLGTVNLTRLGPGSGRTDLSYVSHPDARGHGTMTTAVRLVTAYAFREGTDVVRWEAYAGNEASLRVARAAGFRFEGVRRLAADHRGRARDTWSAALLPADLSEVVRAIAPATSDKSAG